MFERRDTLIAKSADARVKLRILATTDLHMQGLSFNYHTGMENNKQGFVKTATLIRAARAEMPNTILVDNGDLLCGTGVETAIAEDAAAIHPMVRVMNDLGYDAATPGNHDFDLGLQYLTQAASRANFPFVSANALLRLGETPTQDRTLFHPFTILERSVVDANCELHRLRIGITGFLPPGLIAHFSKDVHCIQTRDILQSATNIIPQMKAAGADLIVVLAHTGLGGETHEPDMENAAIPLAALDGIDAVIAGHRHQVFPGPDWENTAAIDVCNGSVHNTPFVSPGALGSHLGVIDLDLENTGGAWIVRDHTSAVRPIFSTDAEPQKQAIENDAAATKILTPTHDLMLKINQKPVGSTAHPLTGYFSLFTPARAVQLIQRAQLWFAEERLAAHIDPALPLLSSACSFRSGGYTGLQDYTDIPAGNLTRRAVSDLYPFPNHLALLRITGAQLGEWLERAASVFQTAEPGRNDTCLKTRDIPSYVYESVFGVNYTIDIATPPRYDVTGRNICQDCHRIQDLSYAGQPVAPDQEFTLITNSFRLGGGGFYPESALKNVVETPATAVQDVLAAFLRAHPNFDPELVQNWHFAPVPGAGMVFRSSPKALAHLNTLGDRQVRPLHIDEDGYQVFQLIL